MAPNKYNWGTGRRKTSIARVRIRLGEGKVVINEKGLKEYFTNVRDQGDVMAPLNVTNKAGRFDVFVNVQGGGTTGQAGACLLGLARALVAADPSTFEALRDRGFLTRDSREVERKKYGFRKARRSFQFSKR
ncbi:MAG: 30S ribosomal protein S9 [Sedimentisphaerales bacterium]|nr:30S ribosomal protein S9 [Sedimentisphaerales bacterium]MBN2843470.1 30S ribosomal protein S9 [Sedimentisphaerales bacterium]